MELRPTFLNDVVVKRFRFFPIGFSRMAAFGPKRFLTLASDLTTLRIDYRIDSRSACKGPLDASRAFPNSRNFFF